jgi:hypothetical protein
MAKAKKNSRSPAMATKVTPEQLVASAATGGERRIIALGGGTWVYLVDPLTGKNRHLPVASDRFVDAVTEQAALSPAYAARLERELASFDTGHLPDALARLRDAGVFSAA